MAGHRAARRNAEPPLPVEHVLLDFGGTLVRARDDMLPLFQAAAARAGVTVPWDAFREANDTAWEELWPTAPGLVGATPSFADRVHERALRQAGATGPVEEMVRAIRDEAVSPRWHVPYPDSEEVLRALRANDLRLHLVSNNVDYLPVLVRNLGWSGLFASITYSQEVGASKPDPRIFRRALERSGSPPDGVVHVGDSWEADVLGARAAGVPAIWLNRTGRPAPTDCRQIPDLRALLPLVSARG